MQFSLHFDEVRLRRQASSQSCDPVDGSMKEKGFDSELSDYTANESE